MTYDSRERSDDAGQPVELYTFHRDYLAWRFTSADRDEVVDVETFKAATIRRTAIEQGSEMNRSALKLTVPRAFPIAELYRIAPPTDAVTCIVQRRHAGDAELATVWTGRVVNVAWSADGTQATITLEPVFTSLRRNGLRRTYGRLCPHVLYGPACRANREAFVVAAAVSGIAGAVITAPAWAARPVGYFDGGYVEWEVATGIFERRFISAHSDGNLTLASRPAGMALGALVRAYPGCDHTLNTCHTKFANVLNYGGTPFIPTKNPFDGTPVY